jgi:hypothetical protein
MQTETQSNYRKEEILNQTLNEKIFYCRKCHYLYQTKSAFLRIFIIKILMGNLINQN